MCRPKMVLVPKYYIEGTVNPMVLYSSDDAILG